MEIIMGNRIPVAVLAATGAVGQRFVSLLHNHPNFEIVALTASERSEGKRYGDAVNWVVPGDIPESVRGIVIRPSDAGESLGNDARLVFSALPTENAKELEPQLAAKGYQVCSNASAYRMDPLVPLLIPEINHEHVRLIDAQRAQRHWPGYIIAAPNCATTGIVFPLRAIYDAFGIEAVHAVTMQAISGAGYPGVSSFDILDNVIPYIKNEEDKIEEEPLKLLGTVGESGINFADFTISAQVNRVPVMDGHMAALSIKLKSKADIEDVKAAIREWQAPAFVRDLASTPEHPMVLREEVDRPQPRRDRDAGNGMTVSVGRVQPCPVFDVKLVVLVHNTLRGAAAGALQNAELLEAAGYVGEGAKAVAAASN
jgi:aspartate-semialdehyde dehydrogenase